MKFSGHKIYEILIEREEIVKDKYTHRIDLSIYKGWFKWQQ